MIRLLNLMEVYWDSIKDDYKKENPDIKLMDKIKIQEKAN